MMIQSELASVITSLVAGSVFGLSAGFSPGPLMALVIAQTLRHNVTEGVKIAFAPLITDLPIVLLALFVLTRLANSHIVLGLISLAGGLFVLYLAYESFQTRPPDVQAPEAAPQSLGKGVALNLLSPHPYLFWLSIGAPTVISAWAVSPWKAAAFIVGFYVCLVGSKVALAVLAGKSRQLLMGRAYGYLMRALGVLLAVFAFFFFRDGLVMLGLLRR